VYWLRVVAAISPNGHRTGFFMDGAVLIDIEDPRVDVPVQILVDAFEEAEHRCGDTMLVAAITLEAVRALIGDERREELRRMLQRLDAAIGASNQI
jgi:hypothetical protein